MIKYFKSNQIIHHVVASKSHLIAPTRLIWWHNLKQLQILPREGKDLCTHCNGLGVNQATHPFYTPSLCLCTCLCVRVFVFVKNEECIGFFSSSQGHFASRWFLYFYFFIFQAHTLLKLGTNLTQTGNAAKSLTESLKSPSALYWGHDKKKNEGER